jgi:hypothetical protein
MCVCVADPHRRAYADDVFGETESVGRRFVKEVKKDEKTYSEGDEVDNIVGDEADGNKWVRIDSGWSATPKPKSSEEGNKSVGAVLDGFSTPKPSKREDSSDIEQQVSKKTPSVGFANPVLETE